MAGVRAGGLKAVETLKEKYGEDYFSKIGRKGGKAHGKGGFNDRSLARRAGAKGGRISKRPKAVDNLLH